MKATVLKTFVDKHTKVIHRAGDELDLTCERFAEVNSTRRGMLVTEIAGGDDTPPAAVNIKPETVAPAQDGTPTPSNDVQPGTVELDQADTPPASEDIKPKTAEPKQHAKPEKKTRQTKKA